MSDKIHPPTPRRRQEAIEQGRGPCSNEVVSAGSLLASAGLLMWFGPNLAGQLTTSLTDALSHPPELETDPGRVFGKIVHLACAAGCMLLPILLGLMTCSIGLNLLQRGLRIRPEKLLPSAERLSPMHRVKAMTSMRSLGKFAITVLKFVSVAAISIALVREKIPDLLVMSAMPLPTIAVNVFEMLIECCVWIGGTLLVFSGVDYALARWQFERDLMMTEQELRDEIRDSERSHVPAPARAREVQRVAA